MFIKEITNLNSSLYKPNELCEIIYQNFIHLSNIKRLKHNKNEIYRLLLDDNMIGYIVYEGKYAIAYLIGEIKILYDGRKIYYITYLYVLRSYRSQYIGTILMEYIINKCYKLHIRYIILTCDIYNKKIYNFYKKFGFQVDIILRTNDRYEVLVLYL